MSVGLLVREEAEERASVGEDEMKALKVDETGTNSRRGISCDSEASFALLCASDASTRVAPAWFCVFVNRLLLATSIMNACRVQHISMNRMKFRGLVPGLCRLCCACNHNCGQGFTIYTFVVLAPSRVPMVGETYRGARGGCEIKRGNKGGSCCISGEKDHVALQLRLVTPVASSLVQSPYRSSRWVSIFR